MLGTGNALTTECYNTSFILQNKTDYFLVDGGGGNTILRQLKYSGINWKDIKNIFVTHKHIDHITGIIWLIRMICQYSNQNEYEGEAKIYAHSELIKIIDNISRMLLNKKEISFIGEKVHLVPVEDKETVNIINHNITFFDIGSKKARQFGFSLDLLNGKKFICCGDEPYNDAIKDFVQNSTWLMHEAFCLYSEADIFKPYEKYHSTVKDACKIASELNVENLILYHTEDKNIKERKNLYIKEGTKYFKGNLYVPNDLEHIILTH